MLRRKRVPSSSGPDEETIDLSRLARADFSKRRRADRLRRLRPWLIGLLLLALIGGGIWLVFFSSELTARRVEVSGEGVLSPTRITKVAAVPMGRPLARIDLDAVRKRVESLPPVKSADVSRGWPHAIRIKVEPRVPVAVIDTGKGLQAFDAEGVLFGSYPERPAELPMVQASLDTKAEALSEGAKVLRALPADLAGRIDYLRIATIDQISLVFKNGRTVMWGSSASSAQKAEVLDVLLKRPGQHLDVSVPAQPTIK